MIEEIPIPTELASAATFGGQNGEILFVVTGNLPINPYVPIIGERVTERPAGDLFLIGDNPTPGLPAYRAVV